MYKLSLYNLFVPYGEKVIYFNTLKGSSFTLSLAEHERIQGKLADPISFELAYPSVFKQFKSFGLIVDEEVEELDEFRFRYHEKMFANRNYHLTLACGRENDLDTYFLPQSIVKGLSTTKFPTLVKRHIRHMVESERIDSLCLEWTGGEPLLHFAEWIEPVCQYARQECRKHGIDFHAQVASNGLLLPNVADKLESNGIRCVKIPLEDSEAKHDKTRHHKGKPTFKTVCDNIIRLCREFPAIQVELEIGYDTESRVESLQELLNRFPENLRDNITLAFCLREQKQQSQDVIRQNETLLSALRTQGFATFLSDRKGKWMKQGGIRMYQRTLLFNGEFYLNTPEVFSSRLSIGHVDEKTGEMIRNEEQFIKAPALFWFENEHCRKCKLLPMLFEECGKRCGVADKRMVNQFCLMKTPGLSPEFWVVKNFEAKSALVALNAK